MSDPTPTPDAPAPDLEALARDYAGRCGWPMDGTAFRNVHPSDMARALLAFHKEAALRHSNCGAPSGLLSAVLADYLAGRDAAGFLSRQSESKTQRLEAAQKYDHCNQMVERIQAALRAERDEAQPVAENCEDCSAYLGRPSPCLRKSAHPPATGPGAAGDAPDVTDPLVEQAEALLALDAKGVLVPHGVCGLARQIIERFIARFKPKLRGPGYWTGAMDGSRFWVDETPVEPSPAAEQGARERAPQYTLSDSGRLLLRGEDYEPIADAIDADPRLMQRIADLLNQHGDAAP